MRTQFDVVTKSSKREIVDGQQRLRAILDFADNKLRLSNRAAEFKGLTYDKLSEEQKEIFLSYPIAVDQLVNANNDDVLEVFDRLNSYTVILNAAEKRHAAFQGLFKTAVHEASTQWRKFFTEFKILTIRDCVRMQDDQLFADLFGIFLRGVIDFDQKELNSLYKDNDKRFDNCDKIVANVHATIRFIQENLSTAISDSVPLSRAPQFLILFAAVAHALFGIPPGDLEYLPSREGALQELPMVLRNLEVLNDVLSNEEPPDDEHFAIFYVAAKSTTQRIDSRNKRFQVLFKALQSEPIS